MQSHIDSLVTSGRTYHDGCDYCRCASLQTVRESENLDGSRFMLQQHIKLLFREEPGNGMPNWYSPSGQQQGKWLSNDMQLSYALRKYAASHSFVLPCAGAAHLCIDADTDRGAVGTTTTGERVTVRTEYIFRLFSRGSQQVWSERLRHLRAGAPLLFAHSRADAQLMLRLLHTLEAKGVEFVHVAVTGLAGVQGASEHEMRALFGFVEFDWHNQRLGFYSLNVGHDFERRRGLAAATLAETMTHMTELLKAIAPALLVLPVAPGRGRSEEEEEAHAALTGARLAADYLGIPCVVAND
jgi:hypothetical protein